MSNLDQALAQAIDRYRHARPASERIFNDATLVLPGGNTRSVLFFAPFPPAMTLRIANTASRSSLVSSSSSRRVPDL